MVRSVEGTLGRKPKRDSNADQYRSYVVSTNRLPIMLPVDTLLIDATESLGGVSPSVCQGVMRLR